VSCLPRFDRTNPQAVHAARQRAARLVTAVSSETRAGVRAAVEKAFREGLTSRQLASHLRSMIGLTERDARAVERLRAQLRARGASEVAVERQTARYSAKLLRERARTIARTEVIGAQSAGQDELWRQAEEKGLLTGEELREWLPNPDACQICAAMRGQRVRRGEMFTTGDGRQVPHPPAHPRCRCSWGLAEPEQLREAA
jgi:hypothetical protein